MSHSNREITRNLVELAGYRADVEREREVLRKSAANLVERDRVLDLQLIGLSRSIAEWSTRAGAAGFSETDVLNLLGMGQRSLDLSEEDRTLLQSLRPEAAKRDQLAALIDTAGFSLSDISSLAGVSEDTVSEWRHAAGQGVLPDRLEDLRAITEFLVRNHLISAEHVGSWFGSNNGGLAGKRPLDELASEGGFEAIIEAAQEDHIDRLAIARVRRGEMTGSTTIKEFAEEFGVGEQSPSE